MTGIEEAYGFVKAAQRALRKQLGNSRLSLTIRTIVLQEIKDGEKEIEDAEKAVASLKAFLEEIDRKKDSA